MSKRGWHRFILAFALVMAVGASLWFAAPVRALTIGISGLPSSATLGSEVSFDITINIEDDELLPIQNVNLYIYDGTDRDTAAYKATCANLPLSDGGTSSYTGGFGQVDVTAAATNWVSGYGYGYVEWEGAPYNFGYGYGYGYGAGADSITYSVTWVSPAGWPAGVYTVEAEITAADSTTFTKTQTVTLSKQVVGGGGGAGGVDVTPPRISQISYSGIDKTTAEICWKTQEKSDSQVKYGTSSGIYDMLSKLDTRMLVSHCITLTDLTPGTTYYYQVMSKDKEGNLATSDEQTFTTLGTPAMFVVKSLEITPAEVEIGEPVLISVVVSNTGEGSGTYEVTLMVDKAAVATKQVTIDGFASEKVVFTTTQDVAKTYSVSISGLSGSFVVKAAPAPTTTPTTTTTTPAPTTPEPTPSKPINWWLIGGILTAVIIVSTVVWLTVIRQRP